MIGKSTYEAARMVAKAIENHFALQLDAAGQHGEKPMTPEPKASVIEKMLDTAFWASLRREEGRIPKISIAYLPPDQALQPLLFEQRIPFNSVMLTKLSPGVERPGIHLGVWQEHDELYIWGTTRKIPDLCLVLDVSEPGLLVIKHRRLGGFGKFMNVAILYGDQVKIIDEHSALTPDCPSMLTSLLSLTSPLFWNDSVNILVQLAVSMRAHGRGGALLVVPQNNASWRTSIVHPINYAVNPSFNGLSNLMQQEAPEKKQPQWMSELRREIDHLGGLTAVDGATIITDQYELLAFGTKISRAEGKPPIESIYITEPVLGVEATTTHPAKVGGTRHLSAAQFVHDQQDAMALVASQDGRFTIFSWSPCLQLVQAHRIDALLL
jgi:hypothetical protein